jgi:hypothetical protein
VRRRNERGRGVGVGGALVCACSVLESTRSVPPSPSGDKGERRRPARGRTITWAWPRAAYCGDRGRVAAYKHARSQDVSL